LAWVNPGAQLEVGILSPARNRALDSTGPTNSVTRAPLRTLIA
jgi:hypothetical protein